MSRSVHRDTAGWRAVPPEALAPSRYRWWHPACGLEIAAATPDLLYATSEPHERTCRGVKTREESGP